jgi:hypothetical protein
MSEESSTKRVRINTTISAEDKAFLDRFGINASTVLSMGMLMLKRSLGLDENPSSPLFKSFANLAISNQQPRTPSISDEEINALTQRRIAALQRIKASMRWKSVDEMAEYLRNKKTTLHGLEEVHEEDDNYIH